MTEWVEIAEHKTRDLKVYRLKDKLKFLYRVDNITPVSTLGYTNLTVALKGKALLTSDFIWR